MTALEVEAAVARKIGVRTNLIVPNVSWGLLNYEADMLIMSKAGYLTEIEIKTTWGDFKKDFEKKHFHDSPLVKYLYYAFPEKLWKRVQAEGMALLPDDAGTISIWEPGPHNPVGYSYSHYAKYQRTPDERKSARKLTMEEQYQLARLGALRMWGLKAKIANLKYDNEQLRLKMELMEKNSSED